jgi:hypothetical protein
VPPINIDSIAKISATFRPIDVVERVGPDSVLTTTFATEPIDHGIMGLPAKRRFCSTDCVEGAERAVKSAGLG